MILESSRGCNKNVEKRSKFVLLADIFFSHLGTMIIPSKNPIGGLVYG
jgi:hypothetical protein